MLTWLSCFGLSAFPSMVLILVIIVPIIVLRSSMTTSVNRIPTTESSLYQPITSVTRVANDSAETMSFDALPLLAEGSR